MPNKTESKNRLHVSHDLSRTPETALSNPRGLIEPSSKTIGLTGFGYCSLIPRC